MILRAGRDEDADGFIALIGACWAEYPGCVMDVDGEVPELRALASYYAQQGGALWVAGEGDAVAGMVGTRPLGDASWELCKMYLAASARGGGTAQALIAAAEDFARAQGGAVMQLWSDTRFDRAHRFYEKQGYVRRGAIRALNDLSNSLEYPYWKPLIGSFIVSLDAPGAESAVPALARLQARRTGMDVAAASRVWHHRAREVAQGSRAMLLAWQGGVVAGTISLGLTQAETGRHRATVQDALTGDDPTILRGLIHNTEREARDHGRRLLVMHAAEGGEAEALCAGLGWTDAGVIPDYTLAEDGTSRPAVIFYRQLG